MARRGARRDVGKERLWRRLLRLWRRSGQTVRDFCAEHDVSEPSFFAWRRALAERDRQRRAQGDRRGRRGEAGAGGNARSPVIAGDGAADAPPRFAAMRVVATSEPSASRTFEVVLPGGRVVRVPVGFDAASLRRLLAVLEERPC